MNPPPSSPVLASSGPSRQVGSVLGRLLDPDGDPHGFSLRNRYEEIRRDLQALLNARRPWATLPDRYGALRGSMLAYGLPDFAAGAFNAPAARQALCREIAATIRRFEPRLREVTVSLRDRPESTDPVLRLRIEGLLPAAGGDEPVSFDSLLDATTTDMLVGPRSDV